MADVELSEADVQFIKELRAAKEEGRISRRDALKVAGALGIGGVVGGAGGASMFGTAAGGASTSDSDGNVGLPDDRVDVFAEGIDAVSTTTDLLDLAGGDVKVPIDSRVVPVADGVNAADTAVDPSTTTTPFSDALKVLNDAGARGDVLFTGSITENAAISNLYGNVIRGVGQKSQITFSLPSSTDHGFEVQKGTGSYDQDGGVENCVLYGGGKSASSNAINVGNGDYEGLRLDRVIFNNWGGGAVHDDSAGSSLYNCDWGWVKATNMGGDVFNFGALGIANTADSIIISAGIDGRAWVQQDFGHFHVDGLNVSNTGTGSNGEHIYLDYGSLGEGFSANFINFEPGGTNGGTHVVYWNGGGCRIGRLSMPNGTVDSLFGIYGGGGYIGRCESFGTVNVNRLEVESDFTDPIVYEGPSGDVTDNSATTTAGVSCLADQSIVN